MGVETKASALQCLQKTRSLERRTFLPSTFITASAPVRTGLRVIREMLLTCSLVVGLVLFLQALSESWKRKGFVVKINVGRAKSQKRNGRSCST